MLSPEGSERGEEIYFVMALWSLGEGLENGGEREEKRERRGREGRGERTGERRRKGES